MIFSGHEQKWKNQISCYLTIFLFYFSTSLIAQNEFIQIGGGVAPAIDVTVTASSIEGIEVGENTISGIGILPNLIAASRFLGQASLGADYETIEDVAQKGFEAWIDEQTAIPYNNTIEQHTFALTQRALDSVFANNGDPTEVTIQRNYWYGAWWNYAMTSPDILRAKVAYALSQIFVISENEGVIFENPMALADYYDMLCQHAFGNFRDLLGDVTFHPAMGAYLTSVNNPKADFSINRFPDENYAREVMQLFTIGLYQLNPDGTRQLDENGNFIPTYTNLDIVELAKVFTGLTYGDAFFFGQNAYSQYSFAEPMQAFEQWHEPGPKTILGTHTIPQRSSPDTYADINEALDVLFNHSNVGPFISLRLIQRLVKSNPSPAYVGRVSAVFDDNGAGERGDLKAVVKAILLDPEARDCSLFDSDTEGMLREPMIIYTHLMRAFNAANESGDYRNTMGEFYEATGQRPLSAPTVFNFFLPDYQPAGAIKNAGKVDPAFQILTSETAISYANQLHNWLWEDELIQWFNLFNGETYYSEQYDTKLNLEDEIPMAHDIRLEELLERLNLILVHGQMTERTKETIYTAVSQFPASNPERRVKMAIFLVMMSPDYLIFK